jgi:hypothetical protein
MASPGHDTITRAVEKAGSAAALARALGYDDAKTARLRRALRGDTGKVGADLVEDAKAYLGRDTTVREPLPVDDYIAVNEHRFPPPRRGRRRLPVRSAWPGRTPPVVLLDTGRHAAGRPAAGAGGGRAVAG